MPFNQSRLCETSIDVTDNITPLEGAGSPIPDLFSNAEILKVDHNAFPISLGNVGIEHRPRLRMMTDSLMRCTGNVLDAIECAHCARNMETPCRPPISETDVRTAFLQHCLLQSTSTQPQTFNLRIGHSVITGQFIRKSIPTISRPI